MAFQPSILRNSVVSWIKSCFQNESKDQVLPQTHKGVGYEASHLTSQYPRQRQMSFQSALGEVVSIASASYMDEITGPNDTSLP